MDSNDFRSLEQRVLRLEKSVEDLKIMLVQLLGRQSREQKSPGEPVSSTPPGVTTAKAEPAGWQVKQPPPTPERPAPPPKPTPVSTPAPPPKPKPPSFSFELPEHMKKIEFWLNKIGIALVLFAVAFLFKYSIDKGWLTPWVRVLSGLTLGVVLIVLGYRTYGKRRHFSLVFLGGGIATFYITAFAAFQRLAIVSHPVAFGFMVLVTLFALALSLKQDDAVLSLLGTVGGFGTPFMLYTGSGDIPALMLYTCLLIAATGAIYFLKGWRSLMWVSVVSGWAVILISLGKGMDFGHEAVPGDRAAIYSATVFALLAFWVVPSARETVRTLNPARWKDPPPGKVMMEIVPEVRDMLRGQAYWLAVTTPLIALAISHSVWPSPSDTFWGWITMLGAAVYFGGAYILHSLKKVGNLAYTHVLVGTLLFTIGLCFLLEGDNLFFSIAAEATVLHLIAHRTDNRGIGIGAHLLFGILAVVLVVRLVMPQTGTRAVFNSLALADLWGIGCAFGLSYLFRSDLAKRAYFLLAYFALAAWFYRELDGNLLFVMLTAQALGFHMLTCRGKDILLQQFAHVFSFGVGVWLTQRIIRHEAVAPALVNVNALANFGGIAVAGGLSRLFGTDLPKRIYFLAAYFLLAGWFCRELSDNNVLFVVLTAQAFVFHILTHRAKDEIMRIAAHVFSVLLGLWLIERLADRKTTATAILNVYAFINLLAIIMGAAAAWMAKISFERVSYAVTVHILFMGWLLSELVTLNDGQGYVTIAWGLYGALLLIVGLRRNDHRVRLAALATLFAVVGKLFLVDLAHLEAIFRILLFMGFGAAFLALSYYFRSLWKSDS
jgi:hypothetical protein